MSVNNDSLITDIQSPQEFENGRDNMAVVENPPNANQQNVEILRCFVCDVKVHGRHYALATCKTQSSRARVIEKLGELVGERYVVVISEDDAICRNCANLINTLDRLEPEIRDVKGTVLRFLERKYSLAEGELLKGNEIARAGLPPQITKNGDSRSVDYHTRNKREAISTNDENCQMKRDKKSNILMECDKCRYTTLYSTYMIHHTRQHMKQKVRCNKCGVQFPGTKTLSHRCNETGNDNHSGETENMKEEPRAIQTAPVEMINIPIAGEDIDEDACLMPLMPIQPNLEVPMSSNDGEIQLIGLTNPNALQFQNFLANDETLRDGQFMRVLQQLGVSDDVGQTTLTVPTISNDTIIKSEDKTTKQILTLAEDGSLEMVAVNCWNDDNPIDRDPEMTF